MLEASQIISNERDTYYNFRTNEKLPFYTYKAIEASAAALLTGLLFEIGRDFLEPLLAIYSILIGFSFSVLFSLVAQKPEKNKSDAIEDDLAFDRISKLHKELFHNVSYFILVALTLLVVSLACFAFQGLNASLSSWLVQQHKLVGTAIEIAHVCLRSAAIFTIMFLIVDSIVSFSRIVGRVVFYFENRVG